jgi:hypothetical protein
MPIENPVFLDLVLKAKGQLGTLEQKPSKVESLLNLRANKA